MKPILSVVTGQITDMVSIGAPIQSKNSFMTKLQSGFNLVELVIVIVVAGIMATVVAPIVMRPFLAYDDTSRRVVLVDAAEAAMRKIAYDVNHAIPNTLRVSGSALELMPIRGGIFFMLLPPPVEQGSLLQQQQRFL